MQQDCIRSEFDYVVSENETLLAVQKFGQSALKKGSEQNLKTIIITNSPAAKKFLNKNYPQLAKEVVYYPSAQQCFGTYFRDSFAKKKEILLENVKLLSVTNDNENASEAVESSSVHYVMNAREIYRMFLRTGVDLKKTQTRGIRSDSGEWKAGDRWILECQQLDTEGWKSRSFTIQMNGETVPAASANTLGGSRKLLQKIQEGNSPYRVVRINA